MEENSVALASLLIRQSEGATHILPQILRCAFWQRICSSLSVQLAPAAHHRKAPPCGGRTRGPGSAPRSRGAARRRRRQRCCPADVPGLQGSISPPSAADMLLARVVSRSA